MDVKLHKAQIVVESLRILRHSLFNNLFATYGALLNDLDHNLFLKNTASIYHLAYH